MLGKDTTGNERRIIGATGYARSGKDTVGRYLVEHHGFTRVSFADAVRDAVYALNPIIAGGIHTKALVDTQGWEWVKTEYSEGRRLLQVMGTEVGRMLFGENVWVDIADRKIQAIDGPVVITDVRFENEAEYVRSHGGEVWWVYRQGIGPVNAHASDNIDFATDVILPNDGTLEDLYNQTDVLIS